MAGESITQGSILKVKKGSGGTLAAIGSIVDFDGPNTSRTVIAIGAADSANSANIQKAGRETQGTFNFTVNLDPDDALQAQEVYGQLQLASALVNDSTSVTDYFTWQVTLDDTTTMDWAGFVSNFNTSGADDGVVTATFSVALQSAVTFNTP